MNGTSVGGGRVRLDDGPDAGTHISLKGDPDRQAPLGTAAFRDAAQRRLAAANRERIRANRTGTPDTIRAAEEKHARAQAAFDRADADHRRAPSSGGGEDRPSAPVPGPRVAVGERAMIGGHDHEIVGTAGQGRWKLERTDGSGRTVTMSDDRLRKAMDPSVPSGRDRRTDQFERDRRDRQARGDRSLSSDPSQPQRPTRREVGRPAPGPTGDERRRREAAEDAANRADAANADARDARGPGSRSDATGSLFDRASGLESGKWVQAGGGVRIGREPHGSNAQREGREWLVSRPGSASSGRRVSSHPTLADAVKAAENPEGASPSTRRGAGPGSSAGDAPSKPPAPAPTGGEVGKGTRVMVGGVEHEVTGKHTPTRWRLKPVGGGKQVTMGDGKLRELAGGSASGGSSDRTPAGSPSNAPWHAIGTMQVGTSHSMRGDGIEVQVGRTGSGWTVTAPNGEVERFSRPNDARSRAQALLSAGSGGGGAPTPATPPSGGEPARGSKVTIGDESFTVTGKHTPTRWRLRRESDGKQVTMGDAKLRDAMGSSGGDAPTSGGTSPEQDGPRELPDQIISMLDTGTLRRQRNAAPEGSPLRAQLDRVISDRAGKTAGYERQRDEREGPRPTAQSGATMERGALADAIRDHDASVKALTDLPGAQARPDFPYSGSVRVTFPERVSLPGLRRPANVFDVDSRGSVMAHGPNGVGDAQSVYAHQLTRMLADARNVAAEQPGLGREAAGMRPGEQRRMANGALLSRSVDGGKWRVGKRGGGTTEHDSPGEAARAVQALNAPDRGGEQRQVTDALANELGTPATPTAGGDTPRFAQEMPNIEPGDMALIRRALASTRGSRRDIAAFERHGKPTTVGGSGGSLEELPMELRGVIIDHLGRLEADRSARGGGGATSPASRLIDRLQQMNDRTVSMGSGGENRRAMNERIEGPTPRQAGRMAERRRRLLADDANDREAVQIAKDLRDAGRDPDTGRPVREPAGGTGTNAAADGTARTGRSDSGRLRNFRTMDDEKLTAAAAAILGERNDDDARQAVIAALRDRDLPVPDAAAAPSRAAAPNRPSSPPSGNRTGRSSAGRLRNYRSMSDEKLRSTIAAVASEGNDAEALAALRAELQRRTGPDPQ